MPNLEPYIAGSFLTPSAVQPSLLHSKLIQTSRASDIDPFRETWAQERIPGTTITTCRKQIQLTRVFFRVDIIPHEDKTYRKHASSAAYLTVAVDGSWLRSKSKRDETAASYPQDPLAYISENAVPRGYDL